MYRKPFRFLQTFIKTTLKYLDIALAIVVVFVVRLLKPLVHIRFGVLQNVRIGHFASEPEIYLTMRQEGVWLTGKSMDWFWYMNKESMCNTQLAVMWKRVLWMHPFVHRLYTVTREVFKDSNHLVPRLANQDRDIYGLLEKYPPSLSFTSQEHRRGQAELVKLGIPSGTQFVTFHSRDNGYYALGVSDEQIRLYGCRNSDVTTFLPAMDALHQQGYSTVRMGVATEAALPAGAYIDYAQQRTDFMDIYLCANCMFHVGDSSGLAEVPKIFRRPLVFTNVISLESTPTGNSRNLFIPKKQWLIAEERFLTFKEILERGIGAYRHCTEFADAGIKLIDSTPAEIQDVVLEMHQRLNGTWQPDPQDELLQSRYWSLYTPNEMNQVFLGCIGAQFLRDHRDWLD